MYRRQLPLALAAVTAATLTYSAAAPAAWAGTGVTVAAPVPGVSSLGSVSCPTATACVAVGSDSSLNGKSAVIAAATGVVTAWPGTLTSQLPRAVACRVKATTCLAVADDAVIAVTVAGGAMKITARPKPPTGGIVALGALACATAKSCYAVGFQGTPSASTAIVAHLSGAGKLLSKTKEPGTGIGAIACPSSTLCLLSDSAAGQTTIRLLTSGHLGTGHALPAHTYVQALSCYKASLCYALGGNASASPSVTDELFPLNPATGAVGSMATIAGLNGTSLSCISASICLVAGFTGSGATAKPGVVVVTGGKPGTPKNYPGSSLSSVACASASRCYAVGQDSAGAIVDKVAS